MTKIIDLDDLLGEDKKVRLAGKTYILPPDLPADLYLAINRFGQDGKTEAEMFQGLYEKVLELFQYKDPDLKGIDISLGQLVAVVGAVYGNEETEGDAVPPPRKAGTRSTQRRSKTTRSPRSNSSQA